jgi:hypothetical protein
VINALAPAGLVDRGRRGKHNMDVVVDGKPRDRDRPAPGGFELTGWELNLMSVEDSRKLRRKASGCCFWAMSTRSFGRPDPEGFVARGSRRPRDARDQGFAGYGQRLTRNAHQAIVREESVENVEEALLNLEDGHRDRERARRAAFRRATRGGRKPATSWSSSPAFRQSGRRISS